MFPIANEDWDEGKIWWICSYGTMWIYFPERAEVLTFKWTYRATSGPWYCWQEIHNGRLKKPCCKGFCDLGPTLRISVTNFLYEWLRSLLPVRHFFKSVNLDPFLRSSRCLRVFPEKYRLCPYIPLCSPVGRGCRVLLRLPAGRSVISEKLNKNLKSLFSENTISPHL